MGTTYHIKLVAKTGAVDTKSLHGQVEETLAEIDRQMSTYRADSELSRFNQAAAGEWFPVSAAIVKVVVAARAISVRTGGAIDVTVGPLVRLWHFGPAEDGGARISKPFVPPSDAEIAEARQRVGYRNLEVRKQPPALRKKVDGLEVDLSSIAPGYAIDELSQIVRKREVDDFMIELGGEVRADGHREDGKPWRVGVERPTEAGRELESSVPLVDAAIATAGDYRKFFEFEERRYSHVIDPSTGRPVRHDLASVTVVADTCIAADGWDTPLLVLGPRRGLACAERNGIAAMFISRDYHETEVHVSPAWRKRFGDDRELRR
jgi:thiamine biosynthesis lipoprotein